MRYRFDLFGTGLQTSLRDEKRLELLRPSTRGVDISETQVWRNVDGVSTPIHQQLTQPLADVSGLFLFSFFLFSSFFFLPPLLVLRYERLVSLSDSPPLNWHDYDRGGLCLGGYYTHSLFTIS